MRKVKPNEFEKIANNIYKKNNKYNGNELRYILNYLDYENGGKSKGSWVIELERKFAKKFNMTYAIAHNSGTSTLHSCLHAAGVGAFDEVIGPVQTGIWFSYVCLHQNAIPVFVDSDENNFNMDVNKIEEKITKRTKAIIPTHMSGCPTDMDKIMKIANKYNLIVIEDCAQAFLATWDEKKVGTIGHMSSFSFETKKHITSDQGGIVLTNDETYAKSIRKHGGLGYKTLEADRPMMGVLPSEFQDPHFKRHDTVGYNYRLPDVCAVLALAQLERLEEKVSQRRYIAEQYINILKGCEWMIPQITPVKATNSYWTLAVKFLGKDFGICSWKDFYNEFVSNGGDGFFGGLSNQIDEIVMKEANFLNNYYSFMNSEQKKYFLYNENSWPIANDLQPKIMQFKTGFRDQKDIKRNIKALEKTLKVFDK